MFIGLGEAYDWTNEGKRIELKMSRKLHGADRHGSASEG